LSFLKAIQRLFIDFDADGEWRSQPFTIGRCPLTRRSADTCLAHSNEVVETEGLDGMQSPKVQKIKGELLRKTQFNCVEFMRQSYLS